MRKAIKGAAFGFGIVICVGATTVTATWTLTPGGTITATTEEGSPVWGRDDTTDREADCYSSTGHASLSVGSMLSGDEIGAITDLTFEDCVGPQNIGETVIATHFPWHVNAKSYDPQSGISAGTVTGPQATISGTDGCVATVGGPNGSDGYFNFTYSNSDNSFTINDASGNLIVTSVNKSCNPTVLRVGDTFHFHGTYVPTPAQTLTSP